MTDSYNADFFSSLRAGVRTSAEVLVPLLVDALSPASVIDVGCGEGVFLAAFHRAGVIDAEGVDGDYVDRASLEVPIERFDAVDLNQTFRRDRRYDLAMSLEVAEHLQPDRAEGFIQDLVRLAPVICFSAAIPGQGGTDHVNERWQDEWAAIFQSHGLEPIDLLRKQVWSDRRVEPWYAQNIMLYARKGTLDGPAPDPLRVVHPRVFENALSRTVLSGRDLPGEVRRLVGRRVRRFLR